ncbi:hypothetical protein [Streptomyces sp. 4R-3d]|uniref:hypothetical protein n=1 Tax=Streptomyces sp. 4R-3d TaxID=2559605 RepID=UPI0010727373|nr:hypothetical protein [Streptomyces sp. 4R-3d]TFI21334.1 hypothetical protein E4P36_33700 [Streptomyces sp. 4R-3d]
MHDNSEHLASFADLLAGGLAGTWTVSCHPPEDKDDLAELTDRIWDLDLVAASLATHPLRQAAVLTRTDGAQLAVLDRYDGHDGFLVAALAPRALPDEAYRTVREPDGIAVTDDPFVSAEQVASDLLVRYDTALAQARRNAGGGVHPSQPDRVVMTWQPDGGIATAPVGDTAGAVLVANGFVQDEQSGIYRLGGDDTAVQALAVREIGPQLDALGIGISLRRPGTRTAPGTAPAATPPSPAGTLGQASRAR